MLVVKGNISENTRLEAVIRSVIALASPRRCLAEVRTWSASSSQSYKNRLFYNYLVVPSSSFVLQYAFNIVRASQIDCVPWKWEVASWAAKHPSGSRWTPRAVKRAFLIVPCTAALQLMLDADLFNSHVFYNNAPYDQYPQWRKG